jgi:hypothetical protein
MRPLPDARDRSVYFVDIELFDEDKGPLTPTSISWSLTDGSGSVVNSRENVAVIPSYAFTIALFGDDLVAGTNSNSRRRYLTIEAVYESVAAGGPVPLNKEFYFDVKNIRKIA